jgi:methylglutaconyl-CoA hydratase
MEFRTVLYRVDQRVATLTLNRPASANALDDVLLKELTAALGVASKDPAVKIVLLRGAGSAFCSGKDPELLARLVNGSLEEQQADAQRLATLLRTIHELRKPVLAAVEGPAISDGAGIAAACDIVLAAEDAYFSLTEVRTGAIPAIPLVFVAKRVGEARARELALTGREIGAPEAHANGLVNLVVPRGEMQAALDNLLPILVGKNSGNAMALCKELLSRIMGLNLAEALDFATNMHAASRMTADARKGTSAALNQQKPEW